MKIIKHENWKGWINKQPIQPTQFGTLNVTGEVTTNPSVQSTLIKRNPQGINSTILLLDVILSKSELPTKQPQRVHFSESLNNEATYESIEIHYNAEKIANIPDIPVVH